MAGHPPLEIERTWLLKGIPVLPRGAVTVRIEQGYFADGDELAESRIRRTTAPDGTVTCTRTIKRGIGALRSFSITAKALVSKRNHGLGDDDTERKPAPREQRLSEQVGLASVGISVRFHVRGGDTEQAPRPRPIIPARGLQGDCLLQALNRLHGSTEFAQYPAQALSRSSDAFVAAKIASSVATALGLDSLGIDIREVSSGQVGIGRYIGNRTYVSASQQLSGEHGNEVSLEYKIARDWKIGTSATSTGESGIDIIWHKRY